MNIDIVEYKDPTTKETVLSKVLTRFETGDVRTERDGIRTRHEVTSIYRTIKPIQFKCAPGGPTITLPENTEVYPATNLPDGGFWVCYINHKDERIESFHRNAGFWVSENEVDIKLPF